VWWVDYFDQNRERTQESSHSTNKRDAESLLNIRKSEILRGVFRRPVKIAFGEFGKRYMEHAKVNKRSWLRDEQMLGHLKEFFGTERQLSEITSADIEGYKMHRKASVSGSTVNREMALLKRMFNLGIEWDLYLGLNPFRKIKFFREFNTGFRVLNPEEEEKLLRNAASYIQDLVCFALNTGLRIGEIFSLCWQNVNLDKNILNVFAPKTQKIRAVPINANARKVLEYWALGKRNEFVFYNPETGKPFVDLKAGFKLACKKAGITGVTWHTLRHTFASRLVSQGVDIVTVQQLLGHSTITVTMRYTHTNLDAKRAAVEKLLHNGCDKSVTVCTTMQQPKGRLSQNRVVTLNAARS
ncbi:MAG: site-specific integrase, partial [Candidatus Acidiferrales bacterium]